MIDYALDPFLKYITNREESQGEIEKCADFSEKINIFAAETVGKRGALCFAWGGGESRNEKTLA